MSRGIHIPRTDAFGSWRSVDTTSSSDKGKGKTATSGSAFKSGSRSSSSDTGVLIERAPPPPETKRRLFHGDGTSIAGSPSVGQQVPSKAVAEQVCNSDGSRTTAMQADAKKADVP
jgi:hypothetical protein